MSNNSNLNDRDNNIQDNSNIAEGEDKEYDDNYSMNATYEEFETCKTDF